MAATRMDEDHRVLITEFNDLPVPEARAAVMVCAAIPAWADALVAARPWPSADALLAAADSSAHGWTRDDVAAATASHPRIGERPTSDDEHSRHSRREQGSVATDAGTAERLRAGNLAYESRFDRVFLIRAAGRGQDEILTELERRLTNDDDAEWAETATQLREIALLRLAALVDAPWPPAAPAPAPAPAPAASTEQPANPAPEGNR